MGRIIRHTVTITISESWTIVWTDDAGVDDTSHAQATTIVQDQAKSQKEQEETILPAITTDAATDAKPTDVAAKPKTGSQRKHTHRRRTTG